jgi:hypothetical protein
MDRFLSLNEGAGWMLPDVIRLTDYGLGHDDRAKASQPVSDALGPRFLHWQMEQTVEESWEECRRQAAILEGINPGAYKHQKSADAVPGDIPTDLFGNPLQTDLFGNVVQGKSRKR